MNKETNRKLSSILNNQFKGFWEHFHQILDKIPNDRLHDGEENWTTCWILYHLIETAEFYYQDSPEKMKWGKKAGFDWKKNTKEEINKKMSLVTKEILREYAREIENRIEKHLNQMLDTDLLKKDDFEWFDSILGKLIYLLQHNHFHMGELAQKMREMGGEKFKW